VSPGVPFDAPQLVQAAIWGSRSLAKSSWRRNFWLARSWRLRGERQNDYHFAGGEILTAGKFPTLVGGNIGTPAISFGGSGWGCDVDGVEVEFSAGDDRHVSSADAVILNITPTIWTGTNVANYSTRRHACLRTRGRTISPCSTPTTPRTAGLRANARAVDVVQPQEGSGTRRFCARAKIFFATASFAARRRTRNYALSEVPLKGAHNLGMRWGISIACWRDANRAIRRRCGILRQWSTDSNS